MDCKFTRKIWDDIKPLLQKLYPDDITEEEKAFGIVKKKQTDGILLRNWITYLMRECISYEERGGFPLKIVEHRKGQKQTQQIMGT